MTTTTTNFFFKSKFIKSWRFRYIAGCKQSPFPTEFSNSNFRGRNSAVGKWSMETYVAKHHPPSTTQAWCDSQIFDTCIFIRLHITYTLLSFKFAKRSRDQKWLHFSLRFAEPRALLETIPWFQKKKIYSSRTIPSIKYNTIKILLSVEKQKFASWYSIKVPSAENSKYQTVHLSRLK